MAGVTYSKASPADMTGRPEGFKDSGAKQRGPGMFRKIRRGSVPALDSYTSRVSFSPCILVTTMGTDSISTLLASSP